MSEAADDVCREVGLGPKGNGGHFAPVRDSPAGTGLKNVISLKKDGISQLVVEKVNGSSSSSESLSNGNSSNDDEKSRENGSSHNSTSKLPSSHGQQKSDSIIDEGMSDDDSSDSVMEIDPEDPEPMNGQFQSEKRTTNIVMVDDMKTLKSLANTAKKLEEAALAASGKSGSVLESSLLAGKSTSGVTITPAKPRVLPLGGTLLGSGVTISPSSGKPMSRGVGLPVGTTMTSVTSNSGSGSSSSMNSAFTYDKQGQLNDPNLTDDTFVVEAPSFIVPYVYEKPPKESFEEFKDSVKKIVEGENDEKSKEKDKKDEKEKTEEKEKTVSSTEEKSDEKQSEIPESKKPAGPGESFFGSALGKFISNLGMNLVQEHVQHDLLREQTRKAQKDKSATVMHAVMSLKKNLESSRDKNEGFHYDLRKCRLCSYRTESLLSLENHIEVPHLKNGFYRCYYCSHETKNAQDIINHKAHQHGVRARFDRPLVAHQCPQCPFEDSMRGKLTRHKVSCDKRFRSERNQEPPHDWEPPAKIPKPTPFNRLSRPNLLGGMGMGTSMAASIGLANLANRTGLNSLNTGFSGLNPNFQNLQRSTFSNLPQLQLGPRGRGRPVGSYKPGFQPGFRQVPPGLGSSGMVNRMGTFGNSQTGVSATANQAARFPGVNSSAALLNSLGANPSLTIQSISQRNQSSRPGQPSISITPLAARPGAAAIRPSSNLQQTSSSGLKPGQPAGSVKRDFVICEICDGYIKDLEQLRNHMQWIHKVKIHPKMIYNRPPLNCQKCQFRFFTDQGLERHLLGSHGLVTASMQDLANKNQDSGRCPVCGKVYQWKLLNHVSKDHHKTLKPAHLSYKCTVCTATFGQYKLFETHVYTAHNANKKGNNGQAGQSTNSSKLASLKVSDEITITPQGKPSQSPGASIMRNSLTKQEFPKGLSITKKTSSQEDELDDDEEQHLANKRLSSATLTKVDSTAKKARVESDLDSDEGVEEIIDDD